MLTLWGQPKPRVGGTVAAAILAAAVLSGCGAAEKVSPQVAVRAAANTTVHAEQGTFTFSLVGSEDDLNAVLNEGAKLSADDRLGLRLLGKSHIALTTAPGVWGLDVTVGDIDHAVELRYVGKKLYARADVPAIAKLTGASPDDVNRAVQGLAGNGFAFLKDAAAGKWLVADFGSLGDMLKGFAQQYGGAAKGGAAGTPTPSSSRPVPGQFKQARDAVGKALHDNTSVVEQNSDSTGDHYVVTVTSLGGLYAAILPLFSQFPLPMKPPAASELPDLPVAIDAWVKGGRIVRLELPLNQFGKGGGGRVAARLDIARDGGGVTAPADAVPVDVAGMLRQFVQSLSGLSGLGGLPGMNGMPGLSVPGLKGTTG
jgi:hypothetical protein